MTNISDRHLKVHFRMDIDEDGWPPASVESLWAVDLGDGTVRLDNTPWFVRGVASGDIIQAELDGDGVLWAGKAVQPSQNCTIRLIVLKDNGSAAARQSVLEVFTASARPARGSSSTGWLPWTSRRRRTYRESASSWNTVRHRGGGTGRKVCHRCLGSHGSRLRRLRSCLGPHKEWRRAGPPVAGCRARGFLRGSLAARRDISFCNPAAPGSAAPTRTPTLCSDSASPRH